MDARSLKVTLPFSNYDGVSPRTMTLDMLLAINNSKDVKSFVANHVGIDEESFYLVQNGRLMCDSTILNPELCVTVVPRIFGGKGGFGSMLRAIGAQIEKTTNRDACRDLSGRRLRDINEEQRLKRWFSKQAEREREKEEQRQKKLQKLRQVQEGPPLPLMEDASFNRQRAEMADSVFEAVDQGFEAKKQDKARNETQTSSNSGSESPGEKTDNGELPQQSAPQNEPKASSSKVAQQPKKKLKRLMMDEEFDSDLSSEDSDGESSTPKKSKLDV